MSAKFVRFCKKGSTAKKMERIYLQKYDSKKKKLVNGKHVIWGEYLSIDDGFDTTEYGDGFLAITWSPNKSKERYFIHEDFTTNERPLEIIFLDVKQGDGAILITPERNREGKVMVIDAGEGDHMKNFIDSRFGTYKNDFNFHSAILTHPDQDHYQGFKKIFENKRIGFENIIQNGLVERPVSAKDYGKVGGTIKDNENGHHYIYNIVQNRAEIENLFADDSNFKSYKFPPVMHSALNNPKIRNFSMLSTHHNHSIHEDGRSFMPEFAPSNGRGYSIEVLGPVVEEDSNGKMRLRRISSQYGKTKNGHSILLRLHIGKYKIFFGGDLNKSAEKFLLRKYTGLKRLPKKGTANYNKMIVDANKWFGADIMKVCHHGASDVTDEFLSSVSPACFIISSGDEEGHVHPRPDLLGRLGKLGKGVSPVLLSTELQRSTREYENESMVDSLKKQVVKISNEQNKQKRLDIRKEIEKGINNLAKINVETFGAIFLKTDGENLITAFKIEEASEKKRWFHFQYEKDILTGEISLVK